jgi:hypothetical protein
VTLEKFQPPVRLEMVGNVVVLEYADRSIDFQYRKRNILNAAHSVFSQSALDFIGRNMLLGRMCRNELSIVNQKTGRPLDKTPEMPV